ncbi:nucleoporin Nup43 [Panulirus ornatus]|uniref:nucleoporin Nup43 n=1 Tax=Panulirus ornatus TaxID=150431 RepID=UPI003A83D573
MAGGRVSKKYVSRKIKSLRWKPPLSDYGRTDTFVTGSWGDPNNVVALWHVPESEEDPSVMHQLPHRGSVNDIQYVTRDTFAAAGNTGGVKLYQHSATGCLEEIMSWDKIHSFVGDASAPCTALATSGDHIASVGEDGKLVIINSSQERDFRNLESVGGCSVYAVVFTRASEVVTGNMQGHLKLWDLRASQPVKATLLSPDQIAVCHLAGHPTQQHIVAAGGEDGALSIWDMRNTSQPFTIISAHSGPITEVRFHPASPEHLFSCGLDGQLLHWDASATARPSHMSSFKGTRDPAGGTVTVWLSSDVARGSIDTSSIIPGSLLPINSLDVEGSTLLAGSDNEAIYTVRQVLLC